MIGKSQEIQTAHLFNELMLVIKFTCTLQMGKL